MESGKMDGKGTQTLPNGDVYKGELEDDKYEGNGKATYYKFPFYCTKVFRSTVFHEVFLGSLFLTKVFDRLLSTRWGKSIENSQRMKVRSGLSSGKHL